MIVRKPAVDAAALETWVAATPLSYPVSQWSIDGLDLWPLLSTALVSLAILDRIDAVTNHTKVGSLAWQAGVCVDYAAVSRLRKLATRRKALPLPSDRLDGRIVCCASQVHTRTIGEILVTAPLDVPALELQRAERACVYWFEDMSADDPRLDRVLLSPARGLDAIRTAIQNRAARFGLSAELTQLPKMRAWLRSTSEILGHMPEFLTIWLARQICRALSSKDCFAQIFEARGRPEALIMLNSGFSLTAGLTCAARAIGSPVIEVQHGALGPSSLISPHILPHFSTFNSAPNALISWDLTARADPLTLAVGPIGLHLPGLVAELHASDKANIKTLQATFSEQTQKLARRAGNAQHEVLVSLQPGDRGAWIGQIARTVGPEVLFWVRRHGSDLAFNAPELSFDSTNQIETDLASTCTLALVLSRVDAHVTRFSAVALEAAAFGVATLATEPYARDLYRHTIDDALLHVEPDLKRVAGWLRKHLAANAAKHASELCRVKQIAPFVDGVIAAVKSKQHVD